MADTAQPAMWRVWLGRFVVLGVLLGAWTIALPDFSGPDEPAHVVRAAAVAGGQLETESLGQGDGKSVARDVPRSLALGSPIAICYVFDPAQTPCGPTFESDHEPAEVITTAGSAPPLFYALVGGPLRVSPDARGLLLARLANAAVCAALLALAAAFALRSRRRRFLLLGLGVAVTPMACYLAAIINPSGLEIAAAIATWVLLLVAARSEQPISAGVVALLVTTGSLLVLSRALSAVFFVIIVVLVVLAFGVRAFDPRRRSMIAGLAVMGLAFLTAAAWVITHDPTDLVPALAIQPASFFSKVMASVGRTERSFEQMVAAFGWLRESSPSAVHLAWLFATGTMVMFGYQALRATRARLALVGVVVASLLIPIVIEVRGYDEYGLIWQGRYILPLAVGIPLMSGALLDEAPAQLRGALEGARRTLIAVLWVAHCLAFWFLLRRYAVGIEGSVLIPLDPAWQPRLHPWVLMGIVAAASGEWARWLVRAGGAERSSDDADVPLAA